MKKIIIFFFYIISLYVNAQTDLSEFAKIKPPQSYTPQASSLMKMIDYPVNYYSGLVNIEIPLYEIEEGDLRIPITLRYHPSGIKPNENVGRTGAGWSLNAGPQLSRKVNGLKDEKKDYGYFYRKWSEFEKNKENEIYYLLKQERDYKPDIFYYSLLNKSGKFYFDISGKDKYPWEMTVVTNPVEPIRVEMTNLDRSEDKIFSITDEQGRSYRFGSYIHNNWYIEKIISSNKQDSVTYSYNENTFSTKTFVPDTYNIVIEEMLCSFFPYPTGLYNGIIADYPLPYVSLEAANLEYKGETDFVLEDSDPTSSSDICFDPKVSRINYRPIPRLSDRVYSEDILIERCIKTIVTSSTIVEFNGIDDITSIVVKDRSNNKQLRKINFFYKRDKIKTLEKVEVADADNQIQECYSLEYNPLRTVTDNQKSFVNKGIDHWGYYNGWDNGVGFTNKTLNWLDIIKTRQENFAYGEMKSRVKLEADINQAFRETSETYMQQAILTSITYPTGRKSSFFYESHKYLHDYSKDRKHDFAMNGDFCHDTEDYSSTEAPDIEKSAGGLRIKRIEEYDPVLAATLIKEYKYGKDESGRGFIRHQICEEDYAYEFYNIRLLYDSKDSPYPIMTRVKVYGSNPIPNITYEGGASVAYDYVTEYTINNKTGEKLKSIYHYLALPYEDNIYMELTTLKGEKENAWEFGLLLDKTDFKLKNGLYTPLLKKEYSYTGPKELKTKVFNLYLNIDIPTSYFYTLGPWNAGTQGIEYEKAVFQTEFGVSRCKYFDYYLKTGKSLVSKEITTIYNEFGDSLKTIQSNHYDFNEDSNNQGYGILLKKETEKSDRTLLKKEYTYPFNSFFTDPSEEQARLKLLEHNQIETPLFFRYSNNGIINKEQKIKYRIDPTCGLPMPHVFLTNTGVNRTLEEKIRYEKYNKYGRPEHIIKDNFTNFFYLWGFKGKYLIAEIQNTSPETFYNAINQSTVNTTSGNVTFEQAEKLRNNSLLNGAFIKTNNYDPIRGLILSKEPNGLINHYSYDSFGRLMAIKDKDFNILSKYYYKYSNSQKTPFVFKAISSELISENQNGISTYRLKAIVTKGEMESNLQFSWFITTADGYSYERTGIAQNYIEENFTVLGLHTIRCIVKDLLTGKTEELRTSVNVLNNVSLKEVSRNTETDASGNKYIVFNGIIKSMRSTNISLNLELRVEPYRLPYEAIVEISGNKYTYSYTSQKEWGFVDKIDVALNNGEVPIKIKIKLLNQMTYYNLYVYPSGGGRYDNLDGYFDLGK